MQRLPAGGDALAVIVLNEPERRMPEDDQRAALHFLGALPDDVPALLDRLVELSLSHRWALAARQAIAPAWQADHLPEPPQKVKARLDHADDDERRAAGSGTPSPRSLCSET